MHRHPPHSGNDLPGILVVSLDFELYWGFRDKRLLDHSRQNLRATRKAIPEILGLFEEYKIHATWAIVGFLFFGSRRELLQHLPARKPVYTRSNFSPYEHLVDLGENESEDPYHYAESLVRLIANSPGQEIGTHTFSHYYCLEQGQTISEFRDDLKAAIAAARRFDITLRSLVFPRNQVKPEYLSVLRELGITAFRGSQNSWIYRARSEEQESLLRRALRLVDAYMGLTGYHTYKLNQIRPEIPLNIPASSFLRPYVKNLRLLEALRLRRISFGLSWAARTHEVYHLWWHPHNFGTNLEHNLSYLRSILSRFAQLREQYGMVSVNMGELANRILAEETAD